MQLFVQLHNSDKPALVTVHIQSTIVPKGMQKYFPAEKI